MTVEDFFNRFVDGYLLNDLESMSKQGLPAGKTSGAVGYPMLATILSGIELLGSLMSKEKFNTDSREGRGYFEDYWKNILTTYKDNYKGFEVIAYSLLRNGLAHAFLTKGYTFVIKDEYSPAFEVNTNKKIFVIHLISFYEDFKNSYLKLYKPIVDGRTSYPTTKDSIQSRVNEMIDKYLKIPEGLFDKTENKTTKQSQALVQILTGNNRASGASGPSQETWTRLLDEENHIDSKH